VRITSLKVLRSISYWLDENHSNDLYLLKISVNNAIGELEKWKTSTT
jgi:hypothetical protein